MKRRIQLFCLSIGLLCRSAAAQTTLPAPAPDPLAQARSALAANRYGEAEAALRAYLALHETSSEAHFLLGYTLFRETKARESLAEYTAGAKHAKPSAADLRVVGADYVLLSDYADADRWFTLASQWDPQDLLGLYYLGRTKYNEQRFEQAIDLFERCLKLDPRNVKAEDNLALSLQALGRRDEAEQAFRRAIEWQTEAGGKDPWPYIDLGSLYIESNRFPEAVNTLRQAVALAPGQSKAHAQLGKAYLSLQQLDKAQPELERAVALSPSNAPTHYVLGQLYAKRGNTAKAKEEFARYSELNARRSSGGERDLYGPAAATAQ